MGQVLRCRTLVHENHLNAEQHVDVEVLRKWLARLQLLQCSWIQLAISAVLCHHLAQRLHMVPRSSNETAAAAAAAAAA
jgi:hypothetical protein